MVGFAAGQAIDILARLVGQALSDRLGQQFIVENRPGAGGNIATEAVVRAAPDGYTFLVVGANNAINATLYDNLNFNMLRDIVPVAGIYRVPQVMEVNPAFPARTVPEFIAYAKANPGKTNFASAGSGSVAHVTGEYFKMMTGIDMQHIPYRGAPPALTDLIAGQVHVMFDNLPSSIEHIRAGRLRPLAVCSPARLPALPDVPTVAEFVPGFETSAFAGLGAPQGTPADIIETDQQGRERGSRRSEGCRHGSSTSAARPCRFRPASSERSSREKPRSGRRSSSSRVPSPADRATCITAGDAPRRSARRRCPDRARARC